MHQCALCNPKYGICCFSAEHPVLQSENKDWLTPTQDNDSEWSQMLFQESITIKVQLSVYV